MEDLFRHYNEEPNARRAAWVVDQCIGPKHTLHTIVPSGFSSYARICHPGWSVESLAWDDEKAWAELRAGWVDLTNLTPVRWYDTAVTNNRTAHRLMQWFDICSPLAREPGAAGVDPPLDGELTRKMVEVLFEILIHHSGANQECLCSFWEGYGRFESHQSRTKFETHFGQQSHLLFSATLSQIRDSWLSALEYVSRHHSMETVGLAPNAVWPTTRDWYLAVPYYRQSSYFGGPVDIIIDICNAPDLESYEALPGDDIHNDERNKAFLGGGLPTS